MTIRDGMSAKLKRITSAFQKMERAARSADKATQAVNPGRTLENSASLIDRARKRLDAFINRQRDAGKGAEEVSDAWSRTEGLIRKALAVFSVAAVKGQIQKALEEFSNQYNAEVQLGVVMKNAGMDQKAFDAIRDRASELESKTTFGGDTFVAGAAELGTYLKDPEALSAAMGTLANYAAGMGGPSVDQSQMVEYATQLGKALDGTYDGLKKKGFELSEAQQKIIETGTDMEKVAVINDVINQSWKGLAESYANTPTGKIEQFKNKIGQLYEAAGQKLVGGVMRLLTAVTNLLDTLQNTGAKGIANNLSQITGKLDSLTSSWDVSRSTGTINGGDLDSVGSVGKIDSDVNIADEDLKFLRDVAEMRYVQNFVTLTPTVAMDAQISERVDLDDVVSAIERKLEGEFIAAAEGVYN